MRRQRKKYGNPYHAYRGKPRWKKIAPWALAGVAAALLVALAVWLLAGGQFATLPFPWK